MKIKFTTLVFAVLLMHSPLLLANPGWTDYVTVAELVPTAKHYYEVKLPVKENPSGCKNTTWFYQDYAVPGSDKMFTTLLEAVKSGIRVRVFVTGVCNLDGYSEISAVSVLP